MKKLLSFFAVMLLALTLASCKKDKTEPETSEPTHVTTIPEETDHQELIDEVKGTLGVLIKSPDAIVGGFTLPTELANDVTAVWSSGDESLLKIGVPADGSVVVTVMRPSFAEGDKNVTLTATLTLEDVTDTWTIDLRILKLDESTISAETLGEVMIAANADKQVIVNNVAYYGEHGGGYFISSTDGKISYIHGKSGMPEKGKNYKVTATIDNYFNTLQLKDASFVEIDGTPDHEVEYELKTVEELTQLPLASPTNVYSHQTFKLKGVKIIIDGEGNYNTFIVDKDFDETTDERTAENSILLYYHAQIDELRPLAGLLINEIDLVIEGYRSDLFVWYFSYLLPMDQIDLQELSDQDIVDSAKAALNLPVVEFPEAGELSLPTSGSFGSEIAWSFKNEEDENNVLVDLDTGAVTMPDRGRVAVTLLATITSGDAEETKEFTLFIGEFQLETIEDALALDLDLSIMIKGVVTNKFANNTYGMQDGTHSIAIYSNMDLLPGVEYTLVGKRADFNGLAQLSDIEVISQRQVDMPQPVDVTDLLAADDKEALYPLVASFVLVKGLEVTEHKGEDNYGNINFKAKVGEVEYEIRFDSRVLGVDSDFIAGLEVGDTFDLISNLGRYNANIQLGYGPVSIAAEELDNVVVDPREELPAREEIVTIEDFLAEEEGFEGTIIAVVTSLGGFSSFSVEDATGAVAFRVGGLDSASADFKVGDVIVAKVKKAVFNGLIQAELVQGEEYEVIEGNFKRLGIVDLTDVDLSELLEYQSRTVDLDSVEVTNVSIDNFGTIQVTIDNGHGTIVVRWDNRVLPFDSTLMKSLKVGDIISVQGATLGWHNGPQIAVDQTYQVVLVERAPEPTPGPTPVPGENETYTETFEDAELSLDSFAYTNVEYTGVGGVVWNIVHSMSTKADTSGGNYDLNAESGQGIILRRSDEPSSITATFKNGISELSFQYRKAFTGGAIRSFTVEVTNDGVTQTFELPPFGEGSGIDEEVFTWTYSGEALSGDVIVKVYASGTKGNKQATFDNFSWTENN